jgi:CheY-like chemotaxis protein
MCKILLVEDDDVDAMFLARLLKKTDKYDLDHCENGVEAEAYLNNNWNGTDKLVILTDINMPLMDGLELLQVIRANEKTSKIPVFIFTTSDDDKNIEEAYKYGVNGYLLKPFTLDEFEDALLEL